MGKIYGEVLQDMMRVWVDDREAQSRAVDALRGMADVEVVVQRLPLGDYAWEAGVLFERKTLLDLLASIKDGRLFRQAARLSVTPQRGVLILEGTARDLAASGMRREAVQGALISVSVLLGVPLLRSKDTEETARLMYYTARQVQAIGEMPRGKPYVRIFPARRPKGKRRTQLHLLQGLPGVGPERARRLLDTFGSVEAVLTASFDDLLHVSGIGKHTARTIRWAVCEPIV